MLNLLEEYSKDELKKLDIKLLDLKRKPWEFSRGAKTYRNYNYEDDSIACRIVYTYTYYDGKRSILQPLRHIEMFDVDGNIIYTKDITVELNEKQLEALNREIRQGRIDYMRTAAKKLPIYSPFVPEPYKSDFLKGPDAEQMIWNYYGQCMREYIEDGTMDFENKVKNETNQFMLDVLNLNVRPPDELYPEGLTIKQTILHQLTGSTNG